MSLSPITIPETVHFFSEADLAKALRVSRATLRSWRCRGKGPRWTRVGQRAIRYALADVKAFLGVE